MIKKWNVLPDAPKEFIEEFPNLPPLVANLLYHRNVRTEILMDEFLQPDYSKHIHDPFIFNDMEKAVNRIFTAITKKEKITIHGDYDADGVSASVILADMFKALDYNNFDVFLPHRETDGYGINKNTVNTLHYEGVKLIITCDCGISNGPEVELANNLGMDVIITDHHSIPAKLPPACAIIHPKVKGEKYPDKNLAGGGVAFKLMQGVMARHQETNKLLPNGQTHATFTKWQLDMAAIASVADMVPLLGESRTLTKYGLIVLNKTKRMGLQKLLLEARLVEEGGSKKREISADTIGFQIAPRINAAGRMNHANVAYKLFMSEVSEDAADLAFELNKNNLDRQKATEELMTQAVAQVEKDQMENGVLFAIGKGWATGIVGLISSKLKEKYQKPAIVMGENNEEITGSGRSVKGFDMIGAMQEIPEYFLKFGGHPMACGFTLKDHTSLEGFKSALLTKFAEKTIGLDMSPVLDIDAEIDLENVNWDLFNLLEQFKPFGQANEKPKYLARNVIVTGIEPIGKEKKTFAPNGKTQHAKNPQNHRLEPVQ